MVRYKDLNINTEALINDWNDNLPPGTICMLHKIKSKTYLYQLVRRLRAKGYFLKTRVTGYQDWQKKLIPSEQIQAGMIISTRGE